VLTIDNRCECDYEAHNYTYSWEPKADWSRVYASAPEITRYFVDFAEKYDLYRHCKFNHRVQAADWIDERGVWRLLVEDSNGVTIKAEADIFINATGILSTCKWPDIAQLSDFQGPKMHSGDWDQNTDWMGKRVCLIGNGSVPILRSPEFGSN
jgi:cation diffusion facilitator CzcD-associated flavoprotein CzcO